MSNIKRRSFLAALAAIPGALLGLRREPDAYRVGPDGYVQGATHRWSPTTGDIQPNVEWGRPDATISFSDGASHRIMPDGSLVQTWPRMRVYAKDGRLRVSCPYPPEEGYE